VPASRPSSPAPISELPVPTPLPVLTRSGRPRREYRLPRRFRDNLPEPNPPPAVVDLPQQEPTPVRRVLLIVRDRLVTTLNSFGMWRDYPERPTIDPDSLLTVEDLANSHGLAPASSSLDVLDAFPDGNRPSYWPFTNATIYSVMKWLNNGKTVKSESETTDFVHNVILTPTFNAEDLVGFSAHKENQRMDKVLAQSSLRSQFKESSVDILVPSGSANVPPKLFSVPGLLHRKLVAVISDTFCDHLSHFLHFSHFKLFQKSPTTGNPERIHGEIYTSDSFLNETEKVRRLSLHPDDLGCKRERVVAAVMFSSDATHLTDFGNMKAWPIYLMLGNLSKYFRSQPNSGAMHHLAYIPSVSVVVIESLRLLTVKPKLPEYFQDFVSSFHCKWRSQKQQILTHCRRELMQAVWATILDDDFIHAYKYGIVVKCIDGVERRVYPRLFTYSADYPEKYVKYNFMLPAFLM